MKEESIAIQDMIQTMLNRFDGLMIGYEYKESSTTHFVKIKTESGLGFSKELTSFCYEFLINFLDNHNESLCFLDDDSHFKLDNPRIFFKPRMETDGKLDYSFEQIADKVYYYDNSEIENYKLKDVSNLYYTCAA